MNEFLLGQVKRKLNITWEDSDTSARVEEIIDDAIPELIRKFGIANPDFDFSQAGQEHKLFLNYCLYEWNHATDEFDENYKNDILQVREKHEILNYESVTGATDEEEGF